MSAAKFLFPRSCTCSKHQHTNGCGLGAEAPSGLCLYCATHCNNANASPNRPNAPPMRISTAATVAGPTPTFCTTGARIVNAKSVAEANGETWTLTGLPTMNCSCAGCTSYGLCGYTADPSTNLCRACSFNCALIAPGTSSTAAPRGEPRLTLRGQPPQQCPCVKLHPNYGCRNGVEQGTQLCRWCHARCQSEAPSRVPRG